MFEEPWINRSVAGIGIPFTVLSPKCISQQDIVYVAFQERCTGRTHRERRGGEERGERECVCEKRRKTQKWISGSWRRNGVGGRGPWMKGRNRKNCGGDARACVCECACVCVRVCPRVQCVCGGGSVSCGGRIIAICFGSIQGGGLSVQQKHRHLSVPHGRMIPAMRRQSSVCPPNQGFASGCIDLVRPVN